MTAPKVSLITASLSERAELLALCQEGIAAQDYPKDRIESLVDLGTDGIEPARNRMMNQATGEYGLIYDEDDIHDPAQVSTQVACMQRYPNIVACLTSTYVAYNLITRTAARKKHRICSSLMFKRSAWEAFKFVETKDGSCGTCEWIAHYHAPELGKNGRPVYIKRSRVFDMVNLNLLLRLCWPGSHSAQPYPFRGLEEAKWTAEIEQRVNANLLDRYAEAALLVGKP
jgi:hypothetical protein